MDQRTTPSPQVKPLPAATRFLIPFIPLAVLLTAVLALPCRAEAGSQRTVIEADASKNADGLFSYRTVYPLLESRRASGCLSPASESDARLSASNNEQRWSLVSHAPAGVLDGEDGPILGWLLFLYAVVITLVAAGSLAMTLAGLRRRRADALWESEERLSVALTSIGDAVIATDTGGLVTFMNPAAAALTGWEQKDAIGRRVDEVYQVVNDATGQRAEAPVARIFRDGVALGLASDNILIARDGTRRPVSHSGAPIRNRGGITGAVMVFHDATMERQREKDVWEHEAWLRSLIQSSHDGILAYDRDIHLTIWNPAMERLFGVPAEELIGRSPLEAFPSLEEVGEGDAFREAVQGRGSDRSERAFHVQQTGKTGFFESSHFPLFDAEGSLIGGMAIIRDTTERRRAETELARFKAILEATTDFVGIYSPDGRILYVNRAGRRMIGSWEGEDLSDRRMSEFVPAWALELLEREGVPAAVERGVWSGEAALLARDSTVIPTSTVLLAARSPEGEVEYLANLSRDLTERRLLEEQLTQAQKMEAVGQLAGGIAHDFNNLLTPILGFAHLAAEQAGADRRVNQYLREIQSVAERAASLTRQLLVFSRRQIMEPQAVNLNGLILNTFSMLRRLIGEDIELVTMPAPDLGTVRVDPGLMEQVLVNMAVNARDAMPRGGKLTIETANATLDEASARRFAGLAPGQYVKLSVSDTGIGMDEEVRAHLFEPFFTTKGPGEGTGLGLAVCYSIVRQSGGDTLVRSAPGQGATFEVYLPRVEEEAPEGLQDSALGNLPRGTETVLLVEDEPSVRTLVSEVLRRLGYSVLEAEDGEDALRVVEAFGGESIHLLVTDVVMPHMGGRELAITLGNSFPEMKVLFTSGYSGDVLIGREGLDVAGSLIQKPFTPAELARKVRKVLD